MHALAGIPKTDMAALLANPMLISLNNLGGNKGKISTLKAQISLATSPKVVQDSEKFMKVVGRLVNILPTDTKTFGKLGDNITLKNSLIKSFQEVNEFVSWLSSYEPDEKNALAILKNLNSAKLGLEYIIDYLTVATCSQIAIEELKKSPKVFTVEELKKKYLPTAA